MFRSSDNQRYEAQILHFGVFTTGIRKHSKRRFTHLLCVYQPPRILSIPRFLHALVERLPPHAPVKWKQIKKSHKKSMKTNEFRFFKSEPPTSRPPFVFNRKHSLTFVHENLIMARAFKIELSKAHSMASKSRL